MSLRLVHAAFIVTAILLCDFFAFWALHHQEEGLKGYSIASFALSFALVVYLLWFLKKPTRAKSA